MLDVDDTSSHSSDSSHDSSIRSESPTLNQLWDALETIAPAGDESGTGLDDKKTCLADTSMMLLKEIKDWVENEEPDISRVLWLHGPAGTGKSTVANSIAKWAKERRWLDLYICPSSTDPLQKASLTRYRMEVDSSAKRRVIVIDGLDHGDISSRSTFLSYLSSEDAAKLSADTRILVSCRPLADINEALCNNPSIKHMVLEDKGRIRADMIILVSRELGLNEAASWLEDLIVGSGMSFHWIHLACNFIKAAKDKNYTEALQAWNIKNDYLDDLYMSVLQSALPNDEGTIANFRSTMRQLCALTQPVSKDCLLTLRANSGHNDTEGLRDILDALGALFTGITTTSNVQVVHRSFFDFLQDPNRSGEYRLYDDSPLLPQQVLTAVCDIGTHFTLAKACHQIRMQGKQNASSDVPQHVLYAFNNARDHVEQIRSLTNTLKVYIRLWSSSLPPGLLQEEFMAIGRKMLKSVSDVEQALPNVME